eukprot:2861983-Prymnesium_polylepis.1
MLRRVLCGHGVVDVGRAVEALFNRYRNRALLWPSDVDYAGLPSLIGRFKGSGTWQVRLIEIFPTIGVIGVNQPDS